MIEGTVKRSSDGGLEAWISVSVIDAHGELQRCEVIADTGFTGWLTLPEADIRRLGLAGGGYRDAVTASGNMERFDYYETSVSWHGRLHEIEVFQSIDQPLLGMELLEGSRVCVVARDGGEVVIAAE